MNSDPEKQPEDIALWRFGIISPLLHRDPVGFPLYMELEKLAMRGFVSPSGQLLYFSADTLRHWLYLFRKGGLAGLYVKERKDKGITSLPIQLQEAIKELRVKYPAWTIKRILLTLNTQSLWNGRTPALQRFTDLQKSIN